jgi:hypothetical protein
LVEANDPKVVYSFVSKFNFWNDIDVVPVIDIGEVVPLTQSAVAPHFASKPAEMLASTPERQLVPTISSRFQGQKGVFPAHPPSPAQVGQRLLRVGHLPAPSFRREAKPAT